MDRGSNAVHWIVFLWCRLFSLASLSFLKLQSCTSTCMGYDGMNDRIENDVGDWHFGFHSLIHSCKIQRSFPDPPFQFWGRTWEGGLKDYTGAGGNWKSDQILKIFFVVVEKTEKCHKKRIKRKFMTPTHQSATSTIDNENWRFIIDPVDIDNRYCNNTHNHYHHHRHHHRWDLLWILELKVNNTG